MSAERIISVLLATEAMAGGTRRHLFDLAENLDRARFRVAVLCSPLRNPRFAEDAARLAALDIPVYQAPMRRNLDRPWRDLAAGLAMTRHLRRHPCDVLHTHSSKAGFLGRWAARRVGRPPCTVHTPHVFPFRMRAATPLMFLYERLEKMAAGWTDRFICVCEDERRDALRRALAPPRKFVTIHNGIRVRSPAASPASGAAERRRLGILPSETLVGGIGRLVPQKGWETLIAAVALLRPAHPRLKVVVAGDGPRRRNIEIRLRRRGLDGMMRLLPAPADPEALYGAIDIFVQPSLWEGLPYGLLDAMAAGKAVVATAVGGVPEAVEDGRSGILTPPAQPAALADALAELLAHADRGAQMGRCASQRVAQAFRLEDMIAQTEDVYRKGVI